MMRTHRLSNLRVNPDGKKQGTKLEVSKAVTGREKKYLMSDKCVYRSDTGPRNDMDNPYGKNSGEVLSIRNSLQLIRVRGDKGAI